MSHSLSARLTYGIMAVVLVMMVVIAGVVYFTVRKYMRDEAKERYVNILMENHQEIRRKLSAVAVAVDNNLHDIERDYDNPEEVIAQVERIVRNNPSVVRCGVLYAPGYFSDKGRCFVPFATRNDADSVQLGRIDSDYNIYIDREWFQHGLKEDKCGWSEAFYEVNTLPNDSSRRELVTYYTPVHDRQGRPIALLCADMSLEDLRVRMMRDIEEMNDQYEKGQQHQSYFFIIDKEGIYVFHPDRQRVMSHFDESVGNMMAQHRGECEMEVDGVMSWLSYRTIKENDWCMVIVTPEDAVLLNAHRLNIIILAVMILGLLVIYLFCRHFIKKTTAPLRHFAETVDQIALGNFSTPLPEIKSYEETVQLHDAFTNMQTSLTIFVDELQKTTAQKASIERELGIAHDIQMAMLPKSPCAPLVGEIDLYAALTPARDVGGDLYDYFLRDNRLFFCIGDVSGKGVPAALMMAVVRAMFRSETSRTESAAVVVDRMNHNLSEEYTTGYFVTMFVGILDLATGRLDYCNAGHEPPIMAGQPLSVKINLPVGALSDWNYEGQQAQLHPGDMLFLYTDGISEAQNAAGEQFGRKYVKQLAREHCTDTAQQLVELMESEVHRHAGDAQQSDDITLLAIKWQPNTITMTASMEKISQLEPFITQTAMRAGLGEKEAKRLRLAVEEAVANVINHGQATAVTLHVAEEDNRLVLTIDDDGQPFDPTADSPTDFSVSPDERPPGGLGIMLLHQMTDGLSYQRTDGHNILTIIKNKQ